MNIYVTLRNEKNEILEDKTKMIAKDSIFDNAKNYAREARSRYEASMITWEIFLRYDKIYYKLVGQYDLNKMKECFEGMEMMIRDMKEKVQ